MDIYSQGKSTVTNMLNYKNYLLDAFEAGLSLIVSKQIFPRHLIKHVTRSSKIKFVHLGLVDM